jgi:amino acid transporter
MGSFGSSTQIFEVRLREALFGRPIPDSEAETERLGPATAIPVLGLDALSSAAYGPEAALTVLLPLGAAGVGLIAPISAVIVVLLVVVQASYRQTIRAYPDGGGSYTVAKENLGLWPSLFAAAALATDYVLNVAVGISAGVGALVSAVPALHPSTLPICLALLALLTLANLRGLRTTGAIFMAPTYVFVASLGAAIALGLVRIMASGGHPVPVVHPPTPHATQVVSAWIVIRAFASGCTAMTGVEAVSNAVPVFRRPAQPNAERTLASIIGILVLLLAGIALLCRAYGIGATAPGHAGYQSVLSQLLGAVFGRGAFYGLSIASVVTVLCLSANTSFADFPRLCRALALDHYLAESFAHAGRRLVYSTGIVLLASLAAILLVAFRGVTDRLIPLFAVGAFGAFTLSQLGMVLHWRARAGQPGARRSRWINGVGATATGATLAVILVSKFVEGAWITLLFVPALVLLFRRARGAHDEAMRACRAVEALDPADVQPPVVVVPMRRLDAVSVKALRFALGISPEVHAVQVLAEGHSVEDLGREWERAIAGPARGAGLPVPQLTVLRSRYRQIVDPLLEFVHRLAARDRTRFVAVLVPELVEPRWYHFLFFSHTATALKMMLLFRGGPQVVVMNAPWYLRPPGRRRPWLGRARGVVPLAKRTAEA